MKFANYLFAKKVSKMKSFWSTISLFQTIKSEDLTTTFIKYPFVPKLLLIVKVTNDYPINFKEAG